MFLAMASPVFEAMFYGGLAETAREIKILDVQPDAFSALLDYIYTDQLMLNSFELVCDICYAAKKYMLPDLGKGVCFIVRIVCFVRCIFVGGKIKKGRDAEFVQITDLIYRKKGSTVAEIVLVWVW